MTIAYCYRDNYVSSLYSSFTYRSQSLAVTSDVSLAVWSVVWIISLSIRFKSCTEIINDRRHREKKIDTITHRKMIIETTKNDRDCSDVQLRLYAIKKNDSHTHIHIHTLIYSFSLFVHFSSLSLYLIRLLLFLLISRSLHAIKYFIGRRRVLNVIIEIDGCFFFFVSAWKLPVVWKIYSSAAIFTCEFKRGLRITDFCLSTSLSCLS